MFFVKGFNKIPSYASECKKGEISNSVLLSPLENTLKEWLVESEFKIHVLITDIKSVVT